MRGSGFGLLSMLLYAVSAKAGFLNLRPDANIVLFISASRYDALALSLLLSQFESDVAFIGLCGGIPHHDKVALPDLQFIHGMTRSRIPIFELIGEKASDGQSALTSVEREELVEVLRSGGLKKTVMVFSYVHILKEFFDDQNTHHYIERIYIPNIENYQKLVNIYQSLELISFASSLEQKCVQTLSHGANFPNPQSSALEKHALTPSIMLKQEDIDFENDYINAACSFPVFVVMSYGLNLGLLQKLGSDLMSTNIFEFDAEKPRNQLVTLYTEMQVSNHILVLDEWISHSIKDIPPRGVPPDQVHNLIFMAQGDRALRQVVETFPVFTVPLSLEHAKTDDPSSAMNLFDLSSSLSLMMDDVLRLYETCDAIINPRVAKHGPGYLLLDAKLNAYASKIDAIEKGLANMRKRKYDDI
ncbi:unnamed protein product [Albugo candida]|uniref:Uncharacterized protein n=1 Tax=Albugo candida TaxID=65357 RepID=A0A024FY14_9STRA|nr:unnamed protein product [Albugo candida]|eukprot:CCI39469.1 unnamed protein product [Albugo candida]